jgi:hypothetical protein
LRQGTSFTEEGVTVSLKPDRSETAIFFRIDKGSNSSFRKDLKHDGKLCDLLVFYTRDLQKILCLVELKKGELGDASEQLCETRDILINAFKNDPLERALEKEIVFKGYIRRHGGSPLEKIKMVPLEEKFGRGHWRVSGKNDLGEFLRSS